MKVLRRITWGLWCRTKGMPRGFAIDPRGNFLIAAG
jgi:6-phosphogluconolactonase (cycloisomerase 2 family)